MKKKSPDMEALMVKVESLRGAVSSIGEAVTRLRECGIREEILVRIIQDACRPYGPKYRTQKPTLPMIRAVLTGMESLEAHVFGKAKEPGK